MRKFLVRAFVGSKETPTNFSREVSLPLLSTAIAAQVFGFKEIATIFLITVLLLISFSIFEPLKPGTRLRCVATLWPSFVIWGVFVTEYGHLNPVSLISGTTFVSVLAIVFGYFKIKPPTYWEGDDEQREEYIAGVVTGKIKGVITPEIQADYDDILKSKNE